jgi:hypothetical protein
VTDPAFRGLRHGGSRTYCLEPDHPEVQAFARQVIAHAVEAGWRYLKLDFTNRISSARAGWGRKRTSFQSLRDLYRIFREAAGPDVQLNACIGGAGRYALGYADAARAAGDTHGAWESVTHNLQAVWLLVQTNGLWWAIDPDVFYLRDGTELDEQESFLLTGTLGLMGGLFLTSDLPSQWPEVEALWSLWNRQRPHTPRSHRLAYAADGRPRAYAVTHDNEPRVWVGLYNWDDRARDISVPLAELRLAESGMHLAQQIELHGVHSGDDGLVGLERYTFRLVSRRQPRHSLRIAVLEGST